MPWLETHSTYYHAQLGPPDKSFATKGPSFFSWDVFRPLDLLKGLPLRCWQSFPKVLISIDKIKNM